MKNIVLSSVATVLLLFTGCSQSEPAVDIKSNTETIAVVEEVKSVETEVVASEESMVSLSSNENASSNTNLSMSEVESKLPAIYFAFDKFEIDTAMQVKISEAADLGKNGAKSYSVKLEGNCDEWGSDEYNFALGLKRASNVKKALVSEGIDTSRISMVSYGESNAVCSDKTQACWAKNRRVDFKLLP
ncbi:OmpA family protein [Sulfurimonas sp.]|jgi:peptidoglycan-associated lipoprotein|uniref:OmpA family protein n=1 Tax=Sulfurimonas sp. TaxID=2022749 RepID=UPI0025E4EC03|nr:OmpA family protein [Sulfurimonas sp.]MBT5935413.1 OmpA family protein [Sulfurimonas sp.]